jgi:hypothetical protein
VDGAGPEFVTEKPSWNPVDQELVTDQLAVQPPLAVLVLVGVGLVLGVGVGLVLGVALGLVLGVALGLVLGDWLGLVLGVGVGEGCPVPLDKTTIDSAGTVTDAPEKLPDVTDGLAAE